MKILGNVTTIGKVLVLVQRLEASSRVLLICGGKGYPLEDFIHKYGYKPFLKVRDRVNLERSPLVVTTVEYLKRAPIDMESFSYIIGFKCPDSFWGRLNKKYEFSEQPKIEQQERNQPMNKKVPIKITPLMLDVLIFYSSNSLMPYPKNTNEVESAIQFWVAKQILELTHGDDCEIGDGELCFNSYELTERGRVYIEGLLSLPLPEATWCIPCLQGVVK